MNITTDNHLAINIIATDSDVIAHKLIKLIAMCNCTIVKCRIVVVEQEFVGSLHVYGSWNAIAKAEVAIANFEKKTKSQINTKRILIKELDEKIMTYQISALTIANPLLVHEITNFFTKRKIRIDEIKLDTYTRSNNLMLNQLTININIQLGTHISGLRDDFLTLCDTLNIDASIEPLINI